MVTIKEFIRCPVTEPHHTKQNLSLVTFFSPHLLESPPIFLDRFSFYAAGKTTLSKIPKGPTNFKAPTSSVSPGKPSVQNRPPKHRLCVSTSLVGPGKGKTALVRDSSSGSQCSIWCSARWARVHQNSPQLTWGQGLTEEAGWVHL